MDDCHKVVFDIARGSEPMIRARGVNEDSVWEVSGWEGESTYRIRVDIIDLGPTMSDHNDKTQVFFHRFFDDLEHPDLFVSGISGYNEFAKNQGSPCSMSGDEMMKMILSGRMTRVEKSEIIEGL
jgi:hypothetical protein